MIYLDYNATSPYSPKVKAFISNEMASLWANPSSEYPVSVEMAEDIKAIRHYISEFLNCSSKSLIFTSGATESINSVLSPELLKKNKIQKIVSSPMEHHATLDRLKFLSRSGFEVCYVKNNSNGEVDLDDYFSLVGDQTLSTFLFANNETGVINPIKEMASIAHLRGGLFHTDAVQALGKIKVNLEDLDVDYASFTGHKIGSLKGIGLLYSQDIKKFLPMLHGGGQERSLRPGTLNYAGIKSFELALRDIDESELNHVNSMRIKFESELLKLKGFKINCHQAKRLPNTTSIQIQGKIGREVLFQLARKNIYVSTGSACTSGSFEPSHVMTSLGMNKDAANSCLRISIGRYSTEQELEQLISSLVDSV